MCVLPIDHLLLSGVLETRREGEKEILYTHTHKTWKVNYLWAINYLSLSLVAAFWLCPPLSVDDDSDFVFFGGKWWWCRKKKDAAADKEEWIYLAIIGIVIGGFWPSVDRWRDGSIALRRVDVLLLLQNLLLLLLLLVMVAHQVVTRQVEQMLVTFVVVHGRDGCRRVRIDQVTFHLVAQQSRHFFPFRHTINRSGGKSLANCTHNRFYCPARVAISGRQQIIPLVGHTITQDRNTCCHSTG